MVSENRNEIKRLKNELAEEEQKTKILKVVLDMAYEGIVIVDIDGNIAIISKPYADFLGVDDQQVVGMPVTEVIENTRLNVVVKTGKGEEAQLQKIGTRNILANREPIILDGEIKGAVGKVLFKNVKELNHLYKKFGHVQKELENYKGEFASQYSAKYSFSDIVGNTGKILEAKKIAKKAGQTDSNVLLVGESGTGKELFAHAIHKVSSRVYGRFVKVNCAAIPSDLLESELFGYEKGAFTGANKEGKMGKFEMADGGNHFFG
jgi:transcriptional regulator with PAS, ATPase and Fis domain